MLLKLTTLIELYIGWDTIHKYYVNVTVDSTTWGLITTGNIRVQSVNHAKTSDKATNADSAKRTAIDYATNSTNAVNATTAVKATQDGTGAIITNTYVKQTSAQTISAQHNFSKGVNIRIFNNNRIR